MSNIIRKKHIVFGVRARKRDHVNEDFTKLFVIAPLTNQLNNEEEFNVGFSCTTFRFGHQENVHEIIKNNYQFPAECELAYTITKDRKGVEQFDVVKFTYLKPVNIA